MFRFSRSPKEGPYHPTHLRSVTPRYARALRRVTLVFDQGLYRGTHRDRDPTRSRTPQLWTGVHTQAFTSVHTLFTPVHTRHLPGYRRSTVGITRGKVWQCGKGVHTLAADASVALRNGAAAVMPHHVVAHRNNRRRARRLLPGSDPRWRWPVARCRCRWQYPYGGWWQTRRGNWRRTPGTVGVQAVLGILWSTTTRVGTASCAEARPAPDTSPVAHRRCGPTSLRSSVRRSRHPRSGNTQPGPSVTVSGSQPVIAGTGIHPHGRDPFNH